MGLRGFLHKRGLRNKDQVEKGSGELHSDADGHNVLAIAGLTAALDSSNYYADKMLTARAFDNELNLLIHALSKATKDGLVLEFGVASGRTINCIADNHQGVVYGFDVFEGLPEDWRTGYAKGAFAQNVPKVRDNVRLVQGLFSETLPPFVKENPQPISLLHVDCDLYSSTKTIFEHLGPSIVSGTVIVFDEYFNYPGWRKHEYLAFQEFVASRNLRYIYDSFVPSHQQVCVVVE